MAVSGGIVEAYGHKGAIITCKVAAAITAGQLVVLTANSFEVDVAGAGVVKGVGVALRTASAIGDKIPVAFGGIYRLKAAGAIDSGDKLKSAAAGSVATGILAADDPRTVIGHALEDIADLATGRVRLF
jgi:hypothetical protein